MTEKIKGVTRTLAIVSLTISVLTAGVNPANASQLPWATTGQVTSDSLTDQVATQAKDGSSFVAWTSGTDLKYAYRAQGSSTISQAMTISGVTSKRKVSIAPYGSNQALLVWQEGDATTVTFKASILSAETAGTEVAIGSLNANLSSQNNAMSLNVNSNGKATLAIILTNSSWNRKAYASNFDGTNWNGLTLISGTQESVNDVWAVTRNSNTIVMINYYNPTTSRTEYATTAYSASTWSTLDTFTGTTYPTFEDEIFVDASQNIHFVWTTYVNPKKIVYSKIAADQLTVTNEDVTAANVNSPSYARLAVSSSGELAVGFMNSESAVIKASYTIKPVSGSWSSAVPISSAHFETVVENYSLLDVAYTPNGRLVMAWTEKYSGTGRLVYAAVKADSSSAFGAEQRLSAVSSQMDMNPQIITGSDNTVTVTYVDSNAFLYAASLNADVTTFSAQVSLGQVNGDTRLSRIFGAQGSTGQATVFWRSNSNGIKFATTDTAVIPSTPPGDPAPGPVSTPASESATDSSCATGVFSTSNKAGLLINGGANYSRSRTVKLNLSWTGCQSSVLVSNYSDFRSASEFALTSTGIQKWTLAKSKNDRIARIVYVKYKNSTGQYSSVYTDSIRVDRLAPKIIEVAGQNLANSKYSVSMKIADTNSGIGRIYFYDSNKKLIATSYYRGSTRKLTVGKTKATFFKVKDRAGNFTDFQPLK